MKAFVVDDEEPARRRLTRMLESNAGVKVTAQLENASQLLAALETQRPDVVFLDAEMPGMDGITLAQRCPELPPVVFVTAYNHYAVEAFAVDAVDYLLKPVRPERLMAAIEKVRLRQLGSREAASRSLGLAGRPTLARIVSSHRGVIRLFDPSQITRFWSCDKYTQFNAEGEEHMTEESLTDLEARLSAHGFLRIHRAELVRADAVRALRMQDGGYEVELSDGQLARVSRRSGACVTDVPQEHSAQQDAGSSGVSLLTQMLPKPARAEVTEPQPTAAVPSPVNAAVTAPPSAAPKTAAPEQVVEPQSRVEPAPDPAESSECERGAIEADLFAFP